ncbi:MAG: hypothetical protein QOF18_1573 [Frankiaceae bacterium]|jgi:serine protease|nr:hypothetical protein [Frankiaceae bacterium]
MPRTAGRAPISRRGRVALAAASVSLVGVALPALALASSPAQTVQAATHSYRHGLVPTLEHKLAGDYNKALGLGLPGLNFQLTYGGGVNGVGVTTGAPKVYAVFWGAQWGTAGTDANGNTTLTGDPQGTAPRVQAFFKGLGTNNEGWSRVMKQYCEGVASGAKTCPASAPHVGYPTGGALAGVWVDNAAPAPSQATAAQIAQEAVNAAGHFGNTTSAANRNAQYIVLSPTGTHPDGYNTTSSTWCAWHDFTSSANGDIAYSNDPYIPDMGSSCGQNFVNAGAAGTLDGVTIVFGHEYAETITDQFPAGGWTDLQGQENGDKCAWISSGQGASANLALSTGSFAVQSTWGNDFNANKGGCEITHA